MKKFLESFATALGLATLFDRADGSRVQLDDPHRHSRSHWNSKHAAPLTNCGRCHKRVSARPRRRHICVAHYVPAPPRGSRWQNGKLVSRAQP